MFSTEDLAAFKIAIQLCNSSALKKEILFAPGTEEVSKVVYEDNCIYETYYNVRFNRDAKIQWDENLEKKTSTILENLGLAKVLHTKIIGLVLQIGLRMYFWARHHECVLNVSLEFCIRFLNPSHFTSTGLIDRSKVAEELIMNISLNVQQRYKLACTYCFVDQIRDLYRLMSKNEKKLPSVISKQQKLVEFWSRTMQGEIDSWLEGKNFYECLLDVAIKCGNKETIEYCLYRRRTITLESVAKRTRLASLSVTPSSHEKYTRLVFQQCRYNYILLGNWIPCDYYINILFFLYHKMTEDQQIKFLKTDIKHSKRSLNSFVLKCSLNWPYQDSFMKAVNLVWEFLPEWAFADLLNEICDKIESCAGTTKYGEGKAYNYKQLFKEFWFGSPQHFKRYIFSKKEETSQDREWKFFQKLFLLGSLTNEDSENIELILESATDEEKENILLSNGMEKISLKLIEGKKWVRFDAFISYFLSTKEKVENYKKRLIFTRNMQCYSIRFIIKEDWTVPESFTRWCALTDNEIILLKKEMIKVVDRSRELKKMFLASLKFVEIANKFCDGLFSSKEELVEFKELFLSDNRDEICSELVRENKLECVDTFLSWCLSNNKEKICDFKTKFGNERGGELCRVLLSIWDDELILRGRNLRFVAKFRGGKWDQVEKFLSWCFSTEEKINDFKRKTLFEGAGQNMLINLIMSNQLDEAETLFSWLDLTSHEIVNFKCETVITYVSGLYNVIFYHNWHWENIEKLLRWSLNDKESVTEFKDRFEKEFESRHFGMDANGILAHDETLADEGIFDDEEIFPEEVILKKEQVCFNKLYVFLSKMFCDLNSIS